MYGVAPPGREWDGNALIQTIMSAKSLVDVSLPVMEHMAASSEADSLWIALNEALLVKLREGLKIRVLVSRSARSRIESWKYLCALDETARAASDQSDSSKWEVRVFEVTGWEHTVGEHASYPPSSRVNRAKFIVTDARLNIGTSNVWEYFYTTASTSFNSDHAGLRSQVEMAFNRDWSSDHAKHLRDQQLCGSSSAVRLDARHRMASRLPRGWEQITA